MKNHDSNIPWDGDMAKKKQTSQPLAAQPLFSIKGPSGGLFIEIPLYTTKKCNKKSSVFSWFRGSTRRWHPVFNASRFHLHVFDQNQNPFRQLREVFKLHFLSL